MWVVKKLTLNDKIAVARRRAAGEVVPWPPMVWRDECTCRWVCVAGECRHRFARPTEGYDTREECEAACAGACPCDAPPSTLVVRFTGVLSGLGAVTLTRLPPPTVGWASELLTACGIAFRAIGFGCADGHYTLSMTGATPGTPLFPATTADPSSCVPFVWAATATAGGGTCGTGTVTATVIET